MDKGKVIRGCGSLFAVPGRVRTVGVMRMFLDDMKKSRTLEEKLRILDLKYTDLDDGIHSHSLLLAFGLVNAPEDNQDDDFPQKAG